MEKTPRSLAGLELVRALVQRVTRARRCAIDGEVVGSIDAGLCVLVGVTHDDTEAHARKLAEKVWHLRVVPRRRRRDEPSARGCRRRGAGGQPVHALRRHRRVVGGRRGCDAARPEQAEPLVDAFCAALRDLGATVATGRFGADMQVELVNDGPVTLLLEA